MLCCPPDVVDRRRPHIEQLPDGRDGAFAAALALPWVPALPVRTPRLLLRGFRPTDLEPLLAFHSLPDAVRYVPFGPRDRTSMATALDSKLSGTSLQAQGDHLDLAVQRHDGVLVGDLVVMAHAPEHGAVELGWIFDPAHGGRGYATEAVGALLDLVLDGLGGLGAHRAVARVDGRNTASRALCTRVGMRQEAFLVENAWFKGEWSDEVDYALLARERVR